MRARRLRWTLGLVAIASLAIAFYDVVTGGFYFTVAGLRVSSSNVGRPFGLGMICTAILFWLHDRRASSTTTWDLLGRLAPWIAGAAAILSFAIAVRYGIFAAAAADAYGYVSQAAMLESGRLTIEDPLASLVPVIGPSVAPLGYRLATTPGAIAPTYPPGYPLMMALAMTLGGTNAAFYVVPAFGALTVWLTCVLGARVAGSQVGAIAAILVAVSPIFLLQTFEPMSDVPVTAWWLLAWTCATSVGAWSAFGAGLAASLAILTRPNLVLLLPVVAWVSAGVEPRLRRTALVAAGIVPGCFAVAATSYWWYGSPLANGYGPFDYLFHWENWKPNLQHYATWLVQVQYPIVLIAAVAPLARVRWASQMLLFFGALALSYLFYAVFDTWPFLRFFLPGIPLLLILTSAVAVRALQPLPAPLRTAVVLLVCTVLSNAYIAKANELGVFLVKPAEQRYARVGAVVDRSLPRNAALITVLHSGTLRLYGNRVTVRWDMLANTQLDDAIHALRAAGYAPYVVLENIEETEFRRRFAPWSRAGSVDWPPAIEYRNAFSSIVRIFSLDDLGKFMNLQPLRTEFITEKPLSGAAGEPGA